MILHTAEFEPQDELLNAHDFHAACLALTSMGDKYTVIYNGGKDAGASLNHKHMQVVPRSSHSGLESLLKGDTKSVYASIIIVQAFDTDNNLDSSAFEAIPFRLSVGVLPDSPDGKGLHELFVRLREQCGLKSNEASNMILYPGHMVVIPRRTANIDGIDANAAGMTGDVWCSSEAQFKEWQRIGPMQLLLQFGVPKA